MATHINAFEMDVMEKQKAVDEAQGALAEATAALEAHPDYQAPAPEKKAAPKKAAPKKSVAKKK